MQIKKRFVEGLQELEALVSNLQGGSDSEELLTIQTDLIALQNKVEALSTSDTTILETKISNLESLSDEINSLKQQTSTLVTGNDSSDEIQELKTDITMLKIQVENAQSNDDISDLREQIAALRNAFDQLTAD